MNLYQTNSSLRIYKIKDTPNWLIINLVSKIKIVVGTPYVMVLLYCKAGKSETQIQSFLEKRLTTLNQTIPTNIIEIFVQNSLLLNENEQLHECYNNPSINWKAYGWEQAYDYHLLTYGFEFNPGTKEGYQFASKKMLEYSSREAEIDRANQPKYIDIIKLQKPTEDLIPIEYESYNNVSNTLRPFNIDQILSLCFCFIKEIKVKWNGEPIKLRTAPSGGGRHPVEGYEIVLEAEKVLIYHINSMTKEKGLIGSLSIDSYNKIFYSIIDRAPFVPKRILIITAVFLRNMYRYREPRTFRTVHMDVGHMCGNIETLAQHLGIKTFVEYPANTVQIDNLLGINSLRESCHTIIALGE